MEREIQEYKRLNSIASTGGIVIFGANTDREIPVGELKESFNLEYSAYNRSFSDLSIDNAIELYDTCVLPLQPDTVMIHIGENKEYWKNISDFEQKYIALIRHIKETDKKIRIVVVSVKDDETNRHLKNIADSMRVEYQDIAQAAVWNPQAIKDVHSFLQSIGLYGYKRTVRTVSAYDLTKIFFCCA